MEFIKISSEGHSISEALREAQIIFNPDLLDKILKNGSIPFVDFSEALSQIGLQNLLYNQEERVPPPHTDLESLGERVGDDFIWRGPYSHSIDTFSHFSSGGGMTKPDLKSHVLMRSLNGTHVVPGVHIEAEEAYVVIDGNRQMFDQHPGLSRFLQEKPLRNSDAVVLGRVRFDNSGTPTLEGFFSPPSSPLLSDSHALEV